MSGEERMALVQRFHEAAFNQGDPAIVDMLCAPDYVRHDPAFPGGANRDATKQLITMLRAAVPDVHHTWDERIVAGDLVVTRWSAQGTHTGALFRIPPRQKGKKLTV